MSKKADTFALFANWYRLVQKRHASELTSQGSASHYRVEGGGRRRKEEEGKGGGGGKQQTLQKGLWLEVNQKS